MSNIQWNLAPTQFVSPMAGLAGAVQGINQGNQQGLQNAMKQRQADLENAQIMMQQAYSPTEVGAARQAMFNATRPVQSPLQSLVGMAMGQKPQQYQDNADSDARMSNMLMAGRIGALNKESIIPTREGFVYANPFTGQVQQVNMEAPVEQVRAQAQQQVAKINASARRYASDKAFAKTVDAGQDKNIGSVPIKSVPGVTVLYNKKTNQRIGVQGQAMPLPKDAPPVMRAMYKSLGLDDSGTPINQVSTNSSQSSGLSPDDLTKLQMIMAPYAPPQQ